MLSDLGFQRLHGRLERFAPFDPVHYANLHGDLGEADPLSHFAAHGLWQAREFAREPDIIRLIGAASQDLPGGAERHSAEAEARILQGLRGLEIGVFANSIGNFFMREIAELVVSGLRGLGAQVALLDQNASIEARPRCCIFVAPHEFFALDRGVDWAKENVLASSFMYATEQMQTPWFRVGLPYLLNARGVIDLNYQNHMLISRTGIPALFHYPGYDPEQPRPGDVLPDHPLAWTLPVAVRDHDPGDDLWADRPLDLVFLATESQARDQFLAEAARSFAKLCSFIHYVRLEAKPIVTTGPECRPALNRYVCRRTKIVLNIHQGEASYFEWHRMVMQGMWNKALVVSDPCLPHPVFKPGIHYLEERRDRIPKLIEWLLTTPDGRSTAERVRNEAWAALAERASARRMSLTLAEFLIEHRT